VFEHTWQYLDGYFFFGIGGTGDGKCLSISLSGWSPAEGRHLLLHGLDTWYFCIIYLISCKWKSARDMF
jgi:hypothetical protein